MSEAVEKIGRRTFTDVITDIGAGDLERKLSDELENVVNAVIETGKVGKLTVTISVNSEGKMVRVLAESKATIPKEAVESTSFFPDARGSLHRENPRQPKLPGMERVSVVRGGKTED